MMGRRLLFEALLAAVLALGSTAAPAQTAYPNKPIRLIEPFPPGGGADNIARIVMPLVAQFIGQPILIENRPGAGGNVGCALAAHAAPDGYTILHGTNGTHGINQALYERTGFDPIKDFAPISRFTTVPMMLVVHPGLPANSLRELLAYLRANPGKVSFGSAGNGSTTQIAMELFKTMAAVDVMHVPYRGGGPALAGLLGGEVQMMIDLTASSYPQVKAGKLKGLAVTTLARVSTAPDIPTLDEAGLPGYQIAGTDGIYAPAGTPRSIIDTLNAAIRRALNDPQVRERLRSRGVEPSPSTPEELERHIAAELPMWARLVELSGAKVD